MATKGQPTSQFPDYPRSVVKDRTSDAGKLENSVRDWGRQISLALRNIQKANTVAVPAATAASTTQATTATAENPGAQIFSADWKTLGHIPSRVSGLAALMAPGVVVVDTAGNVYARLVVGVDGHISVTQPDGVGGNITIDVGDEVVLISETYADPDWITALSGAKLTDLGTGLEVKRGKLVVSPKELDMARASELNALKLKFNLLVEFLIGQGIELPTELLES